MSKNKIEIPIVYCTDENGFKKYDFEEMANLFENQLSELDESVVVMCSTEPEISESEV
tara:strand:- start:46 stop:219 length:174 start_codon:yes stop_codon:yes gene_type:complete